MSFSDLGNANAEAICNALVQPPLSLAPVLVKFLAPSCDLKLKHGVLGLLKNVSHAQGTRIILGEAGTIEALATSGVWGRTADIAEIVQLSAIGVAKHLCSGNRA